MRITAPRNNAWGVCVACVNGAGLHHDSNLGKSATFSLFSPVNVSHIRMSVQSNATRAIFLQRHGCQVLPVQVIGHAVSDRLGLT